MTNADEHHTDSTRTSANTIYTEAFVEANNSLSDRSQAIARKIISPSGEDQTIIRTMSNAQHPATPLVIKVPLLDNGQVNLDSANKSLPSSPPPSTPPSPLSSSPPSSSPPSTPPPPSSSLSPSSSPSSPTSQQQDNLDSEHAAQGVHEGATHTH